MNARFLSLSICLALTACGGKPAAEGGGGESNNDGKAMADDHGTPHALGNATIGDYTIEVVQLGEVEAGKEGALDLEFPADKQMPDAVRVWIGGESGEGSVKSRLEVGDGHEVHGHFSVPKELAEGAKLWIEVEAGESRTAGSIAFK